MKWISYISIVLSLMHFSCRDSGSIISNTVVAYEAKMLNNISDIEAGNRIGQVYVEMSNVDAAKKIKLIVSNKWGLKLLEPNLKESEDANAIYFDTDGLKFQEAGEVELILIAESKVLDRHKFTVHPQRGVHLIESYMGPKTILVGGKEKAMLTNVTTDKYGNPVKDGTAIDYSLRFPSGEVINFDERSNHLVSFIQFRSKYKTGKIIIGASGDRASIREQEVRIIPGSPASIRLELVEWFPYADSRQMVWLRTGVIRDQLKNVVADGTTIKFYVEDNEGGLSEYKSFTVGGIANVYIENPTIESSWEVYATAYEKVRSNSITLDFKTNIESVRYAYNKNSHTIKVGPIISGLGQHVNDGTQISLVVSDGTEDTKYQDQAVDGYCEIKLKGKKFDQGTYGIALEVGGEKSIKSWIINE